MANIEMLSGDKRDCQEIENNPMQSYTTSAIIERQTIWRQSESTKSTIAPP